MKLHTHTIENPDGTTSEVAWTSGKAQQSKAQTEGQTKVVEVIDDLVFIFSYLSEADLHEHVKERIGTGAVDAAIAKLKEVLF